MPHIKLLASFYPGAGKVKEAMQIYEKMKERNDGCFAAIVEEDGDSLLIRPDQNVAQGDVVDQAVGFVAECARQFRLTGLWSATWSSDSSDVFPGAYGGGGVVLDLATQFAYRVTIGDMVMEAYGNLGGILSQIAAFPFDVPMNEIADDHREWLKENVEDGYWSYFERPSTVEDGCLAEETVFLFKDDVKAVEFKLLFG